MAEFFEPPPPPKFVVEELPQEEWVGPPRDGLPAIVPVEAVLARSEEVAISLPNLWAFPTGFAFEIFAAARERGGLAAFDGALDLEALRAGVIPPKQLRLGVEFPDGSTATNLRENVGRMGAPKPPVLRMAGGSYSGDECEERFWVWPLPPPGPLSLVCEWPAVGIPVTRFPLESEALRAAALRSQPSFPAG